MNSKKECYAYKVYSKGELIAHFKQVKAKPIVVNARRGKGAKPNFGNQNGGNGGTITVVKDLSTKDYVIAYDINGVLVLQLISQMVQKAHTQNNSKISLVNYFIQL